VAVGTSREAAATAWTVPEQGGDIKGEKVEEETREMRVRRYKEKRQNRLFAKKIRYEVRKLNAEKRPRLKVPPVALISPFLSELLDLSCCHILHLHLSFKFTSDTSIRSGIC
jgi:CCT motif